MTGRKECKGLELSTISKVLLLILPLVVAVLALCIGRLGISPAEVIRSIFGKITGNADLESKNELVLWNIRMPRIILAALVGAGLSVSGCTFQSLFSNPLATPDTVGVSSGTCFGAAVAIFFGADFIVTQAVAFLFGIIAVLLTYLAGSGKGKSLNSVVLAGIMIGSLFSALVSFIKSVADVNSVLPVITFWLMGSFAGAGYRSLMLSAQEMLGIPTRIEIGPKDIEQIQVVVVRRDTREKIVVSLDEIETKLGEILETIQKDMYDRAKAFLDSHIDFAETMDEMNEKFNTKRGFIKAKWCGSAECEDEIKAATGGATTRCICKEDQVKDGDTCIFCGKQAKHVVYFGKAY